MSAATAERYTLDELLSYLTPEERAELDQHVAVLSAADPARAQVGLYPVPVDWRARLKAIFPKHVQHPFADRHAEFWAWVNAIELDSSPDPFVAAWPRGGAKSTGAELCAADLGCRGKRRYCLYVRETQTQADKSVQNIAALLESREVADYYPLHADRMVGKYGNSKGWNRERLTTAGGYVIDAVGLDTASRGLKHEEQRPDIIIFDDIDGKLDGPHITKKKEDTITHSILPAGSNNCAVLFIQNLIIQDGIASKLVDGRADYLVKRRVSGPFPAVEGLKYEWRIDERTGIRRALITAGHASWAGQPIEACQRMIDQFGLSAFLKECHPAGALVTMADGSVRPIEDVAVDDQVVSHTGSLRHVTEVMRRPYSGALVTIRRAYRDRPLEATANHPLFVARRQRKSRALQYRGKDLTYQWVPASEVQRGDLLVEPLPQQPPLTADGEVVYRFDRSPIGRPAVGPDEIRATPALLRLLGYYTAEGCSAPAAVHFTFHIDERAFVDEVLAAVAEVFGPVPVTVEGSKNTDKAVDIHVSSTIAARFFAAAVGKHATDKRVPEWVFRCSDDLAHEFVRAYWRGDGWAHKAGFHFCTASACLAEDVRRLLLRFGIVCAVGYRRQMTSFGRGRVNTMWELRARGRFGERLGHILGEPFTARSQQARAFIANGYVHYSVRAVEAREVAALTVYNCEVEEDHSFLAEGIASHNCQHQVKGRAEGVSLRFEPARHYIDLTDDECRRLIARALQSKRISVFGGIDFGAWRFGFTLWVVTDDGQIIRVDEYFAQRLPGEASLSERALAIHEMCQRYDIPVEEKGIPIWGDAANPTDILELNLAFKRGWVDDRGETVTSRLRVVPVASENKLRKTSVDRINDRLDRTVLRFRRGVSYEWRLGMNAGSEGTPQVGSRLMWEIENWSYPIPRPGEEQTQDPDDSTADGADCVSSMRYALMSAFGKTQLQPEPGVWENDRVAPFNMKQRKFTPPAHLSDLLTKSGRRAPVVHMPRPRGR